jgi:DNA-binding CsgD family transcriptional regulator
MAEASAAERARALGEPYDQVHARALEAGLEAAEELPGQWVEGPLYATLARAELARLRHAVGDGPPDPEAFRRAAAGFDALSYPWPAAYAGFRAAEARVQSGDRAAAVEPLRAARAHAAATGAAPLLGEIDALARRARLALAAPDAPASPEGGGGPSDAVAQLGLTPREREVLLLVAAGRTNREIGAELFMSEKTASVHVSRILAKLGVGGRVEAAAVAHRLGLTGAAASV